MTGLLFAIIYLLTALAAITYYRRRIVSNVWEMVLVGVLPLAAAGERAEERRLKSLR